MVELIFKNIEASNIRDLGDTITQDNKKVKCGLVYRGITTSVFTDPEDWKKIEDLHLKSIIDLRAKTENDKHTDIIPNGCTYYRYSAMNLHGVEMDFSPDNMQYLRDEIKKLGEDADAPILFLYRNFPFNNPALQAFFDHLLNYDVPMYFHCTAGKDRTGLCAFLFLIALGCSFETAKVDFMYSNIARQALIEKRISEAKSQEEIDFLNVAMRVNETCFNGAINAILDKYGDFFTYFEKELNLDSSKIEKLRALYLE